MPKKQAAPVADNARWDAIVQAVIDAKAAVPPLVTALHHAEIPWNVELLVAKREKREPSPELKAAYEQAQADLDEALQAVVDAQAVMKAG